VLTDRWQRKQGDWMDTAMTAYLLATEGSPAPAAPEPLAAASADAPNPLPGASITGVVAGCIVFVGVLLLMLFVRA
jgi:hypothetical protein